MAKGSLFPLLIMPRERNIIVCMETGVLGFRFFSEDALVFQSAGSCEMPSPLRSSPLKGSL